MTAAGRSCPNRCGFREFVAQARLGVPEAEHIRYFAELLDGVERPRPVRLVESTATAPVDPHGHARGRRPRRPCPWNWRAGFGVSPATDLPPCLGPAAGAASGRDDVVFGTVLFGRMNSGAARIGFLARYQHPAGAGPGRRPGRRRSADRAAAQLADLIAHEHAPLAVARRRARCRAPRRCSAPCSTTGTATPAGEEPSGLDGVRTLSLWERSTPLDVSIGTTAAARTDGRRRGPRPTPTVSRPCCTPASTISSPRWRSRREEPRHHRGSRRGRAPPGSSTRVERHRGRRAAIAGAGADRGSGRGHGRRRSPSPATGVDLRSPSWSPGRTAPRATTRSPAVGGA